MKENCASAGEYPPKFLTSGGLEGSPDVDTPPNFSNGIALMEILNFDFQAT